MECEWEKVIVHVDMDAFFAQIEERDHPWLKRKPVVIGGMPGHRGVASTCNYVARKYGIHAGMPLTECQRLCPHAIFMRTHGGKYTFVSLQVLDILRRFSDRVEMTSIDEAYLDMSAHLKLFSSLREIGECIKNAVWGEVGLTCSAGIAPSEYVSKMCAGVNKPNGLTIMDLEQYRRAFAPLKVSKLTGVGESTERALNSLGVKTVGQLANFPERILKARFGVYGPHLIKMATGDFEGHVVRPFEQRREEKSVGHERTFPEDVSDPLQITSTLLNLSGKAARRLRQGNYTGRRITVKIRYDDFTTVHHQTSLNYFSNDEGDIYREAVKCWMETRQPGRAVRLVGVRVSHLQKIADSYAVPQGDLFRSGSADKKNQVLKAADDIRDKFGDKALFYAGAV